jgi:hypothetical protein
MKNKNIIQEQRIEGTLDIPLKILQDRGVAVLEAIVEYLKEEKKLKYSEIAILLNRDQRTIWTVYNRVKKKRIKQNAK